MRKIAIYPVLSLMLCTVHLSYSAVNGHTELHALRSHFIAQRRATLDTINHWERIMQDAIARRSNEGFQEAHRHLEHVAHESYQNLHILLLETDKNLADLQAAFANLQSRLMIPYDEAHETYSRNLDPIVAHTGIKLSPQDIYSFILDIDNTEHADEIAGNMSAEQINAELEAKLAKNPTIQEAQWIRRQMGYIFSNQMLKDRFDAFLKGSAAFDQWQRDHDYISPEEFDILQQRNVLERMGFDDLKDSIRQLMKTVTARTGIS